MTKLNSYSSQFVSENLKKHIQNASPNAKTTKHNRKDVLQIWVYVYYTHHIYYTLQILGISILYELLVLMNTIIVKGFYFLNKYLDLSQQIKVKSKFVLIKT